MGNHTIGASAFGMYVAGNHFGVVIVPGLYYIFGSLQEGRSLIKDERETPLSEDIVESYTDSSLTKRIQKKSLKN